MIVAGLALAVLVWLLVERSRAGALVRATVADAPMVRALGVDTGRLVVAVFAFGVVLACLGGVLGAPVLGAYPGLDERVLILGLVVVVLGGLGSVSGAFLGALVIGQVEVLGVSLLPQYASFLVFGDHGRGPAAAAHRHAGAGRGRRDRPGGHRRRGPARHRHRGAARRPPARHDAGRRRASCWCCWPWCRCWCRPTWPTC